MPAPSVRPKTSNSNNVMRSVSFTLTQTYAQPQIVQREIEKSAYAFSLLKPWVNFSPRSAYFHQLLSRPLPVRSFVFGSVAFVACAQIEALLISANRLAISNNGA